ncbi:MAG: hypothetical protein ABJC63_00035 [Gemmatimonadales bacterium]
MNFGPIAEMARAAFSVRVTLVAHGIDVHRSMSVMRLNALKAADQVVAVSAWTRDDCWISPA